MDVTAPGLPDLESQIIALAVRVDVKARQWLMAAQACAGEHELEH
jgi:hypothetical protein